MYYRRSVVTEKCDVSFFVPVYKPNLKWLDATVRSIIKVIRQAAVSAELLLGDDGSPDNCFPVLAGYEKEFSGIVRAFHFPENRGVGATSCALTELSCGRYVASFDQDDIMLPFDLDRVVKYLDDHPETGASYARKYLFNDSGLTGDVHGDLFSPFLQFFQPKININSMLIRREVLFAHESFKPLPGSRINHDVWLMFRLAEDSVFHYDREFPRALYRVHNRQTSTSNGNDQHDYLLMGQDVICRHSELYRQIILDKHIPAGGDPTEERLIQGLCGLALFINQRNPALIRRIAEQTVAAHPEDHGAREVLLQLYQFEWSRFYPEYEQAMKDFAGNADAKFIFTNLALATAIKLQQNSDALAAKHRELRQLTQAPPPIVVDNVPKPVKAVYSWKF